MALATTKSVETYQDIVANTAIDCDFPLYAEDEVTVVYGKANLSATLNVDYTVTLSPSNYDTFQVTPLPALLTKINALITADPTNETNFITVRRVLENTTTVQPETVRLTPFLSREIERIHMKLQQHEEAFGRAILFPLRTKGNPDAAYYDDDPEDGHGIVWDGTAGVMRNTEAALTVLEGNAVIVAGSIENVNDVADNLNGSDTIGDVAANLNGSDTIGIVAGSITNVNNTGSNIGNVNIVATDLAGSNNIGTVVTNMTAITTTSTNIASIVTASDNIGAINIVSTDLDGADTIGVVAGAITNVNNVGNDIANVNIVATNIAAVNNVSSNMADVNAVEDQLTAIGNVSNNIDAVVAVSELVNAPSLIDVGNPLDLGVSHAAVADGTSHPASEYYASLAALQSDYPLAYGLWQEIDGLAIQKANAAQRDSRIRDGEYMVNFPLSLTSKAFGMFGDGKPVIKGTAEPHTGTLQAATASSATLKADAPAFDDYFLNWEVYISSGTGAGGRALVTAYNGTSKVITLSSWRDANNNVSTTPDNTSVYSIYPTYLIQQTDCVPTIKNIKIDGDYTFRTLMYHTTDMDFDYENLELVNGGLDTLPVGNFTALMWFAVGNDKTRGVGTNIKFGDVKATGNDSTPYGQAAGSARQLLFSGSNFALDCVFNNARFVAGASDAREVDLLNINTGCSAGQVVFNNVYMEHTHLTRRDIKLHDGTSIFNGGIIAQSDDFVASTPIGGDTETEVGDKCNDCVAYTSGGSYGGKIVLNNVDIDARAFPLGITGSSANQKSRVIMNGGSLRGPDAAISRYNAETASNQQAKWIGFRTGSADLGSGVQGATFYSGHYQTQINGHNGYAKNNRYDDPIIHAVWVQAYGDNGLVVDGNEVVTRTANRLTEQQEVIRCEGSSSGNVTVSRNKLIRDGNNALIDQFIDVENVIAKCLFNECYESNVTDIVRISASNTDSVEIGTNGIMVRTGTLSSLSTVNWDVRKMQYADITMTLSPTFAAPTQLKAGEIYTLKLIQDATGSRTVTWNSVFKFAGGTAPTLTTTANAVDIIQFISDGTNMYATSISLDVG